jgi:hypothetical protein
MDTKKLRIISNSIFIIGLTFVLLAMSHISTIFTWLIMGISFTYLFGGWYFFKGYHPEGKPLVLALLGYFYSSIFIGFFISFLLSDPGFMTGASTFWCIVLIVVVTIIKIIKHLKGLNQFYIEAIILLALAILQIMLGKS